MAVSYKAISWDRQKRIYDLTFGAILAAGIGAFAITTAVVHPATTAETMVIRATALGALVMLHVILCIGPLARLDARFTPLLYNRRHLGVTMFFLALIHGAISTIQFHALGDKNPLVSLFTAYWDDYSPANGIANFPFEIFGAFALLILFLMAATSHDFWLKNLGAGFWKALHLLVYVAYGSVLVHVAFGALQSHSSPVYLIALSLGFVAVVALHLTAAARENPLDAAAPKSAAERDGFLSVCRIEDVSEGCGKVVNLGSERAAVFRHNGRYFASSNVCRHQGGPLGEGRIVDGCITCPWHGWNYRVEDGISPPPFHEIVPTYRVRIEGGMVYVHPAKNAEGTLSEGASA